MRIYKNHFLSVHTFALFVLLFIGGILIGQIMTNRQNTVWLPKEDTDTSPSYSQPLLVLLTTYMRSGSSVTGSILERLPGAFYVFEPFHPITESHSITYLNGTVRILDTAPSKQAEIQRQVRAWFTCDLKSVSPYPVFMNLSMTTRRFYNCLKIVTKDTSLCLKELIETCKAADVRVIKTIRLNLFQTEDLLQEFPNLHILHLVRDPRGVINSRRVVHPDSLANLPVAAQDLCITMVKDYAFAHQHRSKLGVRYKFLRYEDLAVDPLTITRDIFFHFGFPVLPEVYGFVYCITACGKANEEAYNTERSNSFITAMGWRQRILSTDLAAIMNTPSCISAINLGKYRIFANVSEMRNISVSFSL